MRAGLSIGVESDEKPALDLESGEGLLFMGHSLSGVPKFANRGFEDSKSGGPRRERSIIAFAPSCCTGVRRRCGKRNILVTDAMGASTGGSLTNLGDGRRLQIVCRVKRKVMTAFEQGRGA